MFTVQPSSMKYFITIIALTIYLGIQAQDTNYVDPNYQSEPEKTPKQKKDIGKRTYFGATFGLQFGTFTSILVEPMIGYRFTEKLSGGVGIGFRYGKDNDSNFEYTNYLGRVFTRYIIIPKIYAHVEYMVESYDKSFGDYYRGFKESERTVVPFLFVGGGYRSPGRNGSFIVQVLFNVLQDNVMSKTIYPSGQPYISIGYIGGF